MSIATIWLGCNTLIYFFSEKHFLKSENLETKNPWRNKVAMLWMGIFLLHVLGLMWTENMDYAIGDLKTKVPLLFIPFMLAYLPRLRRKEIRILLWFFVASTLFSIFTCLLVYWGVVNIEFNDVRKITVLFITKVSHIRFEFDHYYQPIVALVILHRRMNAPTWIVVSCALPMLYFLLVIQSMTGILIGAALLAMWMLYRVLGIQNSNQKLAGTRNLLRCCCRRCLGKCFLCQQLFSS